jgi:putative addiction module component (TIGR02574 family)
MAMDLDQLAEAAMRLPAETRAELAERLLESLDAGEIERVEGVWLEEARRRRDDARAGRAKTIPGETALREVRDLLRP